MIPVKQPVSGADFVNRIELLKKLKHTYPIDNIAIVGPRRIGKSSLAEQFLLTLNQAKTVGFRFAVNQNIGTPGKFAVRMLRSFLSAYCIQILHKAFPELDELELDIGILSDWAIQQNSPVLVSLARFLMNYYPAATDNERSILERVLKFFNEFAIEQKFRTAIVLDEFQEIVELGKYKGFSNGNLLAFLEGLISTQENVWYCFTGSSVRILTDILEKHDSPFFGRIKRFNIKPFDKNDTLKLACRCTSKQIAAEASNLLFSLSGGHPFYTNVIIRAAHSIAADNPIITKPQIEAAFVEELTGGGMLDWHCNYLFEASLNKAGSSVFLKEVLRTLSHDSVTLTELARKLGRVTGYLSNPLRNLYNLDLIDKVGNKYTIADNILQIWLQTVYGRNDPNITLLKRKIINQYTEYIANLSTEAGLFFESYMREMLTKFDSQRYKGICLPKFETVECINTVDESGVVFGKPSNIEIDALCLGAENWICEFKYTKKGVKQKEITKLINKKGLIENKLKIKIDKIVYIAKSGFSENALKTDVWCISLTELNTLLKMMNMKKV